VRGADPSRVREASRGPDHGRNARVERAGGPQGCSYAGAELGMDVPRHGEEVGPFLLSPTGKLDPRQGEVCRAIPG